MAILEISDWQSYCSACRKPAAWIEEGHSMIVGYGDDNGKAGCGESWTGVRFTGRVYIDGNLDRQLKDFWGPSWIKNLPLV